MKANFKLVLHGKKDKLGRSAIFLRVTSYYKVKLISTGRRIQARFWNRDREQARSSYPDAVEINQYLEDFVRVARERFRKSGFDVAAVTSSTVVPDLISFIDRLLKTYRQPSQFRIRRTYATLKNKLVEFAKTPIVAFESVNKSFVQEFDSWMKLSRRNRINTRVKEVGLLKRVITFAIEEGIAAAAFPKLKMKAEQSERRRLTIDEIRRLGEYDAPVGSLRYHAKNMFLLSFYIGGSRFEDTLLLEWANIKDGALHFVMGKTGKHYEIALLPEALAIVNLYAHRAGHKYVFPVMPDDVAKDDIVRFKLTVNAKNHLVNDELAVIAADLGIEKFTFHCARHSIADYLRVKGASIYDISKILRHSNVSMTEQYLKQFDADAASRALVKAFEEDRHA
jgi:integrase